MSVFRVLFLIAVFASVAFCRPTHCGRWKGDSEFRCAKDNYHSDSIHIRNVANKDISFKVSKWLSNSKYVDGEHSLTPGGSMDIDFGEVRHGAWHEMFIYSCKIDGNSANCLDAVYPTPNF